MSKISIVITSYNYEDYVEEAIQSVLNQTYQDWELIIVDDGSTDGSLDIINAAASRDSRVKVLTHPDRANKGLVETTKLGVSHSIGEYIAFLESDDFWEFDCLRERMNVLERHPNINLIFNDVDPFGDQKEVDRIVNYKEQQRNTFGGIRWPANVFLLFYISNIVPTLSAVMVRRSALNACNFDSPISPWLDWWLYFQVSLSGDLYFLNRPLTHWRRHTQSYIQKTGQSVKSQRDVFFKEATRCFSGANLPFHQRMMMKILSSPKMRKTWKGLIKVYLKWLYGGFLKRI